MLNFKSIIERDNVPLIMAINTFLFKLIFEVKFVINLKKNNFLNIFGKKDSLIDMVIISYIISL